MDRSDTRDHPPRRAADPVSAAVEAVSFTIGTLVDTPGRRNVRILGLPHDEAVRSVIVIVLVGIPFALCVAVLPFWDHVADWAFTKRILSSVAPAIADLSYKDDPLYDPEWGPRLPARRFLVASASLVALVLLSNFVALLFRGVRRHALLVWICFDRTKLLQYFGLATVTFGGLWYFLLYDWTVVAFLVEFRAFGRAILFILAAIPLVTIVFGHLAAIVGLGAWRDAAHGLRRLRARLR